ncbi:MULTISPECIES: envelope stress response membrane protein PspB [Kordiimonas]|uniref:envelope stress response membrane protein PspB n=1 Tax=Kordiimonas TaxID=288021 RepID=UPI001FF3CE6B|nr:MULTISPECIES: envelope stress response membrane protein PspB [Kordiimonas]MCK0069282.1 envelope stress response membrane protein PspB [Kordiimonas laminariae]
MDEAIPIMIILFVILPWIIFHYITKWKAMKGISPEDEASFSDLRTSADRLEERLRTMERIMDDEIPDWRSRHHEKF